MRLVVDLQGAQGPTSRFRGIGRYSRELALAMARHPGPHELVVALNGNLPADDLLAGFAPLLPPENIRAWFSPGRTAESDATATGRRNAAAVLRAEFLAGLQPDLVHVSSLFEGAGDDVMTRWPSSRARLPMVATCYDLIPFIRRTDYLDGPWRGMAANWYLNRLRQLELCDGLLAISESSRREAIDHLGYRPDRVHNIRAGIGPLFAPRALDPEQTEALLTRYGLHPGFVLFVGAGDLRKNEAGLIAAYGLLPEALRAAHQLVIVGKTDPDELGRSAAAAGVPLAQVALVRFVEEADLPALYSLCAVSVLPSRHEGFGLPAAEAMACGAPTIASNNSSLPEVLGRADALFDAEDPADIAERLLAVLTDAAFRQSLAEHGPRQAGTFTWEDSASRAWAALEQINAEMPRPRPAPPLRRLPSLAFVSPLAPQESGISTYSEELIPALARHYDITLVSDIGMTEAESLAPNFPVLSPEAFLVRAWRFDRVLYQVGNSQFHVSQLETMLPAVPGVVTLHDAYLSRALYWQSRQIREPRRLLTHLLRSHGWPAVLWAEAEGDEAAVERYPCSLPVLRGALGVIQHSAHARDILAEHYGAPLANRSVLIPSLRYLRPMPERSVARRRLGIPDDAFLICSFGLVSHTKMPDVLAAAVAGMGDPSVRLVFVGAPQPEVASQLPAESITGRVDAEHYRLWLAAADLGVQLRSASRGETSAAVTDCLGAGLATVVNAHGAMAELPAEVVAAAPASPTVGDITDLLLALRQDEARRLTLGRAGRSYAATELDPGRIALAYRDMIEARYADAASLLPEHLAAEVAAGLAPNARDLADTARAISATFPPLRPAQLLLASGPPGSWPSGRQQVLRDCLAGHAPDLRVHLVRQQGGRLMQDWAAACTALGLQPLPGEAPAAEVARGDVVAVLDPAALGEDARHYCHLRGARVVLVESAMADTAQLLGLLSPTD